MEKPNSDEETATKEQTIDFLNNMHLENIRTIDKLIDDYADLVDETEYEISNTNFELLDVSKFYETDTDTSVFNPPISG